MGIYLDYAATTPLRYDVFRVMEPWLKRDFANASSFYGPARKAREAIEDARETIATIINAEPAEIFFTSGGSEANNWAVKEVYCINSGYSLFSAIEHHSILNIRVKHDLVPVNHMGIVDLDQIREMTSWGTPLIAVMLVNNEIGTIQPIEKIAKHCMEHDIFFHVDAVQGIAHAPVDVKENPGITTMSISAHKLGGPKGIGCLYISKEAQSMYRPLIAGGHQERNLRAGTENVAAIVGFARAAQDALWDFVVHEHDGSALAKQRYFAERLQKELPLVRLNGVPLDDIRRTHNNLNYDFSAYNIRGEQLLQILDDNDIYASTGSACNTGDDNPSHVLKAIGLTDEAATSSLRFTWGSNLAHADIDQTIDVLAGAVKLLRR